MTLRNETWKRTAELRIHGGRIDVAARLYPSAPQPWIDLSTGINPIAYPAPQIPLALYQRLPLARDIAEMTAAAAEAYGLPARAAIIPVPGSEIAIRLLPRMLGPSRVGIAGPTYGSHAAAWREAAPKCMKSPRCRTRAHEIMTSQFWSIPTTQTDALWRVMTSRRSRGPGRRRGAG